MLNNSIRILNFDDSVLKQNKLRLVYKAEIIDFLKLGPRVRMWMNKRERDAIRERIFGLEKGSINFIGSGDFHHISGILAEQIEEPFSLVIFDFHPDWDILPPRLGCGSWVTEVLKNKNIKKCVIIGASSDDLSSGSIQSGNLGALRDSRVEVYPYQHKPTKVFFREVPENISLKVQPRALSRRIHWTELAAKDWEEFISSLIKRLPAKKVYVSVDKDCLKREYALTNWEEGQLSLGQLLLALRLIKDNLDILGMDIVGDYSPISVASKLKAFLSRLDHPRYVLANNLAHSEITRLNEDTNLKILKTVIGP